jgi:hypothetical protein
VSNASTSAIASSEVKLRGPREGRVWWGVRRGRCGGEGGGEGGG